MIGELDRACWQGVTDARSGRFDPGWRGRTGESYRRAYKRELLRMKAEKRLAQLALWELDHRRSALA